MYVTFSSEALTAVRSHVASAPREEVCGLLLGAILPGEDRHIVVAVPCRNVAADPTRRFEIDPAQLLAAHRAARTGGLAVLGHYHSHPNGSPMPSPRDAADAAPDGALWLIVGASEARLWRAVSDGAVEGRFQPVPCHVAAAAPEGAG